MQKRIRSLAEKAGSDLSIEDHPYPSSIIWMITTLPKKKNLFFNQWHPGTPNSLTMF
jgi:hypothetical protein